MEIWFWAVAAEPVLVWSQGTQLWGTHRELPSCGCLLSSPLMQRVVWVMHGKRFPSHQGWKRSLWVCSPLDGQLLCAKSGFG